MRIKKNHLFAFTTKSCTTALSSVLMVMVSTGAHGQIYEGQWAHNSQAEGKNTATVESGFLSTPVERSMQESARFPAITNRISRPDNKPGAGSETMRAGGVAAGKSAGDSRAAREVSVFQQYVYEATRAQLEVFGANLFSNVPDTFSPTGGVQVNPEYVIGPGDELQIRGWGMVDIDLVSVVDRSGAINIPRVGAVQVAGVKYRDLQGHVKNVINKVFSGFDLTVTVAQTRSVQVYVVGHAARPGTYTLNAMGTLLNALFASGGPDSTGSMRNIQVRRGNGTATNFDLYDVLLRGDKARDIALQDGDVIHIPEVGPVVAITGNVKKPGIFELRDNSSVADVLVWSGGFESSAEQKDVIVEKNVSNSFQIVASMKADAGTARHRLGAIPALPGDIIRVFAPGSIPVEAQVSAEYVRVAGEVSQSGVFQLRKGETLRELISRLGGVKETGYVYALQLNRESARRAQQMKLDEVANRFEREVEANAKQRLSGITDSQNLAAITAEIERQRQLAQKLRNVKAQGRIVLELENGGAEVKNLPDIVLQHGDVIYVPRKPGTVDVLGGVFQANTFIHKPQRTVTDYLEMAGGPTATADTSEMYLLRADGTAASGKTKGWFGGLGGVQLNPGDTIVVPEKIVTTNFMQSLKEWTGILYQFGLGAAGLKVLKD